MLPVVKQARPRSLRSFVHWYNVAVLHAGVAELVDAPDSKSGGRKVVWVRVPPPAQHKFPAKAAKTQLAKEVPRCSRRGCLLQPYCNASAEGFFEGAGGAVLHVGEHVRVGVEGDSNVGVTQHLRDDLEVDILR